MWLIIAGGCFVWSLYYFCLCYFNNKRSAEWNCRIVALTHSFLVCRIVEYFIFLDSWPLDRICGLNTGGEYITLYFSASYFLFDTVWCIYMGTEGPIMLLHHLVCVIGLPTMIYVGSSGAECTFCIWGGELTNPFLQIRWFLRETNNHKTSFAWWIDVIFVLLFLSVRAGIFSVVAYRLYFAQCYLPAKLLSFSFYFVGIIFCFQIIKFAKRKLM